MLRAYLRVVFVFLTLYPSLDAHADFHGAVKAYIAKDGVSLLKEVNEAATKRNDNGLMLFLLATNMDAMTSDYDNTTHHYDSTLGSILSKTQWNELRDLLVKATNNSTLTSQYFLNIESLQFSRELIIKGLNSSQAHTDEVLKKEYTNQEINRAYQLAKDEYVAKGLVSKADDSKPDVIIKQADSGDPYAQSLLGFFSLGYFNFTVPECREIKAYSKLCSTGEKSEGFSWLKRAITTYEQDGLLDDSYAKLSTSMCNLLSNPSKNDENALRQACLWCVLGANLGDSSAITSLDNLHMAGQLKLVNPQLDSVWDTPQRIEVLSSKNIKEWPSLIVEVRRQIELEKVPVFSYLFIEAQVSNALEVYSNGQVVIKDMRRTGNKAELTRVSSERVKQFLADIQKTGINNWPMNSGDYACVSCRQSPVYLRVTIREGNSSKHIFVPDDTGAATGNSLKIAKIKVIVDKYFSTQAIRVELGKSPKIKNELLNLENKWIAVSKKEI